MLKRISLIFMLLMALVGIVGVQAQNTATPQTMAQYLPVDTDIFFAMRTDEAFLDEFTSIVHTIAEKIPADISNPMKGFNLRLLLNTQVGSLATIGVGDYVAGGVSGASLLYDQDRTNDTQVGVYGVVALTDAAKFEVFLERMTPHMTKTNENGVTVYSDNMANKVFITPNAAYFTNRDTLPLGDRLDSSSKFNEAMSALPEPNYNVVFYIDFGTVIQDCQNCATPQDRAIMTQMGFDMENLGPIVVGGTVLDGKSLIIDSYNSALSTMPSLPPIDPSFAALIPSGTSYVIQSTDLTTAINTTLDMLYKQSEMQQSPEVFSHAYLNAQSKAFLGLDLDSDIINWMGGNYALIGDLNVLPLLEAQARGETVSLSQDLRFAFIVQGDGSDKPAKVVQGVGNWLVLQGQHEPSGPQTTLTTTGDQTSAVIEYVPVAADSDETFTLEMVGNPDILLFGDQVTVQAILSGTGASLRDDASYLEEQMYALPNANGIAFVDGDGWGNVIAGGVAAMVVSDAVFRNISAGLTADEGSPTPTPIPTDNLIAPVLPLAAAAYDFISSSSISMVFGEGGSQLTRLVLTLK